MSAPTPDTSTRPPVRAGSPAVVEPGAVHEVLNAPPRAVQARSQRAGGDEGDGGGAEGGDPRALRGSHRLAGWLTLRGLGVVLACAFGSLLVQVDALYGSRGILPAAELVAAAGEQIAARSESRWLAMPTLFWIDASDAALRGACWAGLACAVLVVLGFAQRLALLAAWVLYLSLCTVGRTFLAFQWDALLLESTLCALFLAPRAWTPRGAARERVSLAGRWLLRWLCFRLMLLSGAVKLASGDSTWSSLTALDHHFWTQPLPTWIGWWAHQAPASWRAIACGAMFAIELYLPFLIFGPRAFRHFAAAGFLALQLGIALTGNYGFFNLLAAVLCVPLFDDAALLAPLPRGVRERVARRLAASAAAKGRALPAEPTSSGLSRTASLPTSRAPRFVPRARALVHALLALALAALGGVEGWARLERTRDFPAWVDAARDAARPFRSASSYGLFAVMTTDRGEIVLESTADGRTWREYRFRHKPADPARAPAFVGVHMPRLDWQMWFAALDDWRRAGWLHALVRGILRGESAALALLDADPFAGGPPPRCVRTRFLRYRFTSRAERAATGAWWTTEPIGAWSPAFVLDERGELALAR